MARFGKRLRLMAMIIPPVLLATFLVGAVWGSRHPWPPAESSLRAFPGHTSILVGFRERSGVVWTSAGENRTHYASRSFLLIPPDTTWPKLVTIAQANEAEPTVTEQSASASLFWLVAMVVVSVAAWLSWLRQKRSDAA